MIKATEDLRGWLWFALTKCPPAALIWASLGYRVGVIEGREQLRRELAIDLMEAGAAWRAETGWKPGHPSYAELQRRRGEPVDQVRRNHAQPIRRPHPKPTERTTR